MKLRNRGNYYVPDLVNQATGKVDECYTEEKDVFLHYALQHTSSSILKLLNQHPTCWEEEEVARLLKAQAKLAKSLGISSDYCYQYFGRRDNISQGISIQEPTMDVLFPMKITTTDFMNGEAVFQRRVEIIYDSEYEYFKPKSVVAVEKNSDGLVVQCEFSPKSLSKIRKYIKY